ncbi:MAG: AMP-binding protein [Polyangiaceae bacterium]
MSKAWLRTVNADAGATVASESDDRIGSLADIVDERLVACGHRVAIRFDNGHLYDEVDFVAYHALVVQMIRYLQGEHAVQKVVATLSKNRIEWDVTAMASFYTANILFPIDTKFNSAEMELLLSLSNPDYALVSYAELERFRTIAKKLDLRTTVLVADIMECVEDAGAARPPLWDNERSMKAAIAPYPRSQGSLAAVRASPLLAEGCTVLAHYATSGTTASPKIVRVSHANILAQVNSAYDLFNLRPNETLLNVVPYTHVTTLVEFLLSKFRGLSVVYFTREPETEALVSEIAKLHRQGVRIKALLGTPDLWVQLVKDVLEQMKNKPALEKLYESLSAIEPSGTLHDLGSRDKAKLTTQRILLRNRLGGYFAYGLSSWAKMDSALAHLLGQLGIVCIDLYGTTECTGIVARSQLNGSPAGSSGRLLPGLEYRLDAPRTIPNVAHEVGVLLVKGPTVAAQYIETGRGIVAAPLTEDGYYVTGDLCSIGDDRRIDVVGREQQVIRWDDGTLIDLEYMSNLLTRNMFVRDAMVARRRPHDKCLSVFIYPDYKRLERDADYKKETAAGLPPKAALKRRCVEAVQFAESVAGITPALDKDDIYILEQEFARTPARQLKCSFELERLDRAERI